MCLCSTKSCTVVAHLLQLLQLQLKRSNLAKMAAHGYHVSVSILRACHCLWAGGTWQHSSGRVTAKHVWEGAASWNKQIKFQDQIMQSVSSLDTGMSRKADGHMSWEMHTCKQDVCRLNL